MSEIKRLVAEMSNMDDALVDLQRQVEDLRKDMERLRATANDALVKEKALPALHAELKVDKQTDIYQFISGDKKRWPTMLHAMCFMGTLLFLEKDGGRWIPINKRTEPTQRGVKVVASHNFIDLKKYEAWRFMLGEHKIASGPITHRGDAWPCIIINAIKED